MLPLLGLYQGEATSARGEVVDNFSDGKLGSWTLVGNYWPASRATPALSNIGRQFNGSAGKYFLLTYNRSNQDTGTALSKEFTISRPFLNFKVVGGEDPKGEALGVRLIVDEKPVRITTGNNSLTFGRRCWDVGEFVGKVARIQVVDQSRADQFGFIGVDVIGLSNEPDTAAQDALVGIVKSLRASLGSPGVWACFTKGTQITGLSCQGEASRETHRLASVSDQLMIGSVSKAVTGWIAAYEISKGKLTWKTSVRDLYPDLVAKYHSSVLDATVLDLLCHRGGLPEGVRVPDEAYTSGQQYCNLFTKACLAGTPTSLPGQTNHYASGATLVSAMLERATGASFESLMDDVLHVRMGLASFSMGIPERGPDPYYYLQTGDGTRLGERLRYQKGYQFDASGGMTATITDLARYCAQHAMGRKLGIAGVTADLATFAQRQPFGDANAPAWVNAGNGQDGILNTSGSTGRGEYCIVVSNPHSGCSLSVYMNVNMDPRAPGSHSPDFPIFDFLYRLEKL